MQKERDVLAIQAPTLLAVVGGGPKAAALSAKAWVLRKLGLGNIQVVVIERTAIAANWKGKGGFTDGNSPLGTPPEKDVGFPYSSLYGNEVDVEMLRFSWAAHLISLTSFSDWVDRGRKHPLHEIWARYINWVISEGEARIETGEVTNVTPEAGRIKLSMRQELNAHELLADGVVFTGPGSPLSVANAPTSDNILNGHNYWLRIPIFAEMESGRVAIIGGGETAASIALSLLKRAPRLNIDLINRHGTIYTRGESFHENSLFSKSDAWQSLSEDDKLEFIDRTDRGVFSVASKQELDQAMNVRVVSGEVTHIEETGERVIVKMRRTKSESVESYDKVILALGFNPWSPISMLPEGLVPPVEKRNDLIRCIDFHLRLPLGEPDDKQTCNVHVPMLAGLSQGPGFPNLSCLGELSDRILSLYVPSEKVTEARKGASRT